MSKPASERYEIGIEAFGNIQTAVDQMAEAGLYTGALAKSISEVVTVLSTGLAILDPDRFSAWYKEETAKAYKALEEKQQKPLDIGQYL